MREGIPVSQSAETHANSSSRLSPALLPMLPEGQAGWLPPVSRACRGSPTRGRRLTLIESRFCTQQAKKNKYRCAVDVAGTSAAEIAEGDAATTPCVSQTREEHLPSWLWPIGTFVATPLILDSAPFQDDTRRNLCYNPRASTSRPREQSGPSVRRRHQWIALRATGSRSPANG